MAIPSDFTRVSIESVLVGDVVYVRPGPGAEPVGPMTVEDVDGALLAVSDEATFTLDAPGVEIYGRRTAVPPVVETHQVWDRDARVVRTIETETGNVVSERPYDDSENENADAEIRAEADAAAAAVVRAALRSALADLQLILDEPNATINAAPATRIKTVARALRRVIRLEVNALDETT